jgi:hypothetical protein
MFIFLLIVAFVIGATFVISHLMTPRQYCYFCKNNEVFVYQFRRVDGGPDLRYGNNHIICVRCRHKLGDRPEPEELIAAKERWRSAGFAVGRAGKPNEIPAEIRPRAGEHGPLSVAWNHGWSEGDRQHEWYEGFAAGVAGKRVYTTTSPRYAGWLEGDAKRQRLHYFPDIDASEKVKDAVEAEKI